MVSQQVTIIITTLLKAARCVRLHCSLNNGASRAHTAVAASGLVPLSATLQCVPRSLLDPRRLESQSLPLLVLPWPQRRQRVV